MLFSMDVKGAQVCAYCAGGCGLRSVPHLRSVLRISCQPLRCEVVCVLVEQARRSADEDIPFRSPPCACRRRVCGRFSVSTTTSCVLAHGSDLNRSRADSQCATILEKAASGFVIGVFGLGIKCGRCLQSASPGMQKDEHFCDIELVASASEKDWEEGIVWCFGLA